VLEIRISDVTKAEPAQSQVAAVMFAESQVRRIS
jgi:hypothetical protein